MKKKNYKFLKDNSIVIFFLILIIITIINFQYMIKNSNKNDIAYDREERIIGTNAVYLPFQSYINTITQEFIAQEDNLSEIDIFISNVDDQKSSTLTSNMIVGLEDEAGNIICEYDYPILHFYKSETFTFPIPTIKDSKGKKYTLYINRMKNKLSNLIFIVDSDKNSNEELFLGQLSINNDKIDGNLYAIPIYKSNENTAIITIITIILTVFIFAVIYLINKKKNISLHKFYFMASLILSLTTIIVTPLFCGKDELSHWTRTYEISSGHILSGFKDGWPISTFSKTLIDISSGKNFKDSWNNLIIEYNDEETKDMDMQYMSVYSPISYLPTSMGILISKLIINRPAVWAYAARIVNAIACISLICLAIKLIPFGKKLLFAIGLIPTTINSFSTITADGFLIAITVLMVSYILNIIYSRNKKMNKKDYIILAILSFIISLSKLVYLPFLFFLLLLLSKGDSQKKKLTIIGIIIVGIILNIIWGTIAYKYLSAGQGANSNYYILDTLKHPFQFIQKFIYTWYTNISKYISDLFGGNNAWYGTVIEDASIIPIFNMLIFLMLSLFDKESKIKLNTYSKFIMLAIILAIVALVSVSLYISCTPVGFPYFVGIQGRYFLPLLLPIGLLLNNIKNIKNINLDCSFTLSLIIISAFVNALYIIYTYL